MGAVTFEVAARFCEETPEFAATTFRTAHPDYSPSSSALRVRLGKLQNNSSVSLRARQHFPHGLRLLSRRRVILIRGISLSQSFALILSHAVYQLEFFAVSPVKKFIRSDKINFENKRKKNKFFRKCSENLNAVNEKFRQGEKGSILYLQSVHIFSCVEFSPEFRWERYSSHLSSLNVFDSQFSCSRQKRKVRIVYIEREVFHILLAPIYYSCTCCAPSFEWSILSYIHMCLCLR